MHSDRRPRLTPAMADVRRAVRGALAGVVPFDGESGAVTKTGPGLRGTDSGSAKISVEWDGGLADGGLADGELADGGLLLVALSGGADSLALAAATAFEAPRAGLRAGAVIVDHGLQAGSADAAAAAAGTARTLGLAPVLVLRVTVADDGSGPEGAARAARYAAFERAMRDTGATHVLLGHTRDDQAETVLLGLARGSGPTSLQGMAPASGPYLRPLLGIRRDDTRAFCLDAGLAPWADPQNHDPRFARVRVRETVLPTLERELGPGVAEALARTAELLREDADALDALVLEVIEEICEPAEGGIAVSVGALAANPPAIRHRVIRFVVDSEFGVSLSRAQTLAVARLVTGWHGQKGVDVPGVRVERQNGLLVFRVTSAAGAET